MPLPKPKYAFVDAANPEAFAQCDRCGFWRNRSDLVWQYEWGGMQLYNQQALVCFDRCYDLPNEQLRTIIIPPDPPPIVNARVPNFDYEEYTTIQIQFGAKSIPPWGAGPNQQLWNQDGTQLMILQYPTITQPS
jgi:hypothetical protein